MFKMCSNIRVGRNQAHQNCQNIGKSEEDQCPMFAVTDLPPLLPGIPLSPAAQVERLRAGASSDSLLVDAPGLVLPIASLPTENVIHYMIWIYMDRIKCIL